MTKWTQIPAEAVIAATVEALKAKNIDAWVVADAAAARDALLKLIPEGAEVFNATSATLDATGFTHDLNDSGRYDAVRKRYATISDRAERHRAWRKNVAPDWVVGSVHAVTRDGTVVAVSQGGSQLASYASAGHVVWVVGVQKIVADLDEAFARIREHSVPLEEKRMREHYNVGTSANKFLIVEREGMPGRTTIVFVKEPLGF
ncbi:MAG: LUD domain-containing protein [Thermoplasmatota archaeon]